MKQTYKIIQNGKVIYKGHILSELIETLILNQIKYIDENNNSLVKINKNIYAYLCELSNCYNDSKEYEWEHIKIVEICFNNKDFIEEKDFIHFEKQDIQYKKIKNKLNYKN
ncbi:hypothetical protein HMPREF2664_04340 [Staphylococcus sp. HMSC064E03]|uniref:hypothetical protein n=1 Tax=unclassified Staphylococcus TaxID=91994 RepID=UPI0008A2CF42|nr:MULTISPECIES: hypothetical protein [unclassified Staphylococcus]OFS55438.1 hypothetical protein HMPREF2862_07715 [Staphylococcus sp. HMSC065C09]OHQ10509.1 hypothetical protein HMPREF2664_04340 [Staphylococcus sp. HMSC064E03]